MNISSWSPSCVTSFCTHSHKVAPVALRGGEGWDNVRSKLLRTTMLHQCPVGIVECIGVDVPTHSTEDLTLTLKFGTFDVQDINVPKVDGVEVDLPEQLTFCKSTIKHSWPCRGVDVRGVDLRPDPICKPCKKGVQERSRSSLLLLESVTSR